MKKYVIIGVILVLLLSSYSSVFAGSYCNICGTYSVEKSCYGSPAGESYEYHNYVDLLGVDRLCEYYDIYYKTLNTCNYCSSAYVSGSHHHMVIGHDCDIYSNGVCCPY